VSEKLILATNNAHKVAEIKAILGARYDMVTLKEAGIHIDIEETGSTFAENAVIKASAITRIAGGAALADDSGLVVEALNGEPGVYSARYAGEGHNDSDNIDKLLNNLRGIKNRKAKFVSAIALCRPDGKTIVAQGEAEGIILNERRGEGGFGYDPVFFSTELNKTFAEATFEEKNAVSHRKRALESLAELLSKKA
jgi:XTP/dITP diphosphohydrolase